MRGRSSGIKLRSLLKLLIDKVRSEGMKLR